jgi:LysR family transcriptional activator of nhaA
MDWLNYNQFHYFWVIAREASVTRAARRLRVSQSNLSEQLRDLEDSLGQRLFDRRAGKLSLTEAGRIALAYADTVFAAGGEMLDVLRNRPIERKKTAIRVGAISSLSKNLQFEFVRPLLPLLEEAALKLEMSEGSLPELLQRLRDHAVDVIISNAPVRPDSAPEVFNHRLAEFPVSLVGVPAFRPLRRKFPGSLAGQPLFFPRGSGKYRSDFEALLQRAGVQPEVRAEIEDMALLRLFALSGLGLALVPEIVVQRELRAGTLTVVRRLPRVTESFFAVTVTRKFPNPHIERLVRRLANTRFAA